MTNQALASLAARCKRWGGTLRVLTQQAFDDTIQVDRLTGTRRRGISLAPFIDGYAIDWKAKMIYGVEGRTNIPAIIHEMGHVFAAKRGPSSCREFAFFGWEYLLAKELGVLRAWTRSNLHYTIGGSHGIEHGTQYGDLPLPRRRELIVQRIASGMRSGIISRQRKPLSVRA